MPLWRDRGHPLRFCRLATGCRDPTVSIERHRDAKSTRTPYQSPLAPPPPELPPPGSNAGGSGGAVGGAGLGSNVIGDNGAGNDEVSSFDCRRRASLSSCSRSLFRRSVARARQSASLRSFSRHSSRFFRSQYSLNVRGGPSYSVIPSPLVVVESGPGVGAIGAEHRGGC